MANKEGHDKEEQLKRGCFQELLKRAAEAGNKLDMDEPLQVIPESSKKVGE